MADYKAHLVTLIPKLSAHADNARVSQALQFVQGWLRPGRGIVEAVQPVIFFSSPQDSADEIADQVFAWVTIQDAWARKHGGEGQTPA